MHKLRDYQQIATDAALNSKKNGVLVLPTGSGKSHIIAAIAYTAGGKTIVLQPSKEILEQNKEKIRLAGCDDIGVYSASAGRKDIGAVTLATIGSVVKKRHLFTEFDRIIVDECQDVNSKGGMYEDFINGLGLPVIGLTATPYRLRSYRHRFTGEPVAESRIITRTRPRIFSKLLSITQVKQLFERGYLCPLEYECSADYDSRQIASTSTCQNFDDRALADYNQKQGIPAKIAAIVAKTDRKHCLAFTKFCKESQEVVQALQSRGILCAEVSAETKKRDRERILANFKDGVIKCVVNVGVLTTGFDFPELDCVILGRPTKSVALYYQMVGRGIRIAENKPNCKLIDLCDNVKRFGKIETFEIIDANGNNMWRLKSNVGFLTGTNVDTGQNLEKIKKSVKRRSA